MVGNDPNPKKGRIADFLSNPITGGIGVILAIVGLGLAIWIYFASQDERALTYFTHPVKSIVVDYGKTPKLQVQAGGKLIQGSITSSQIAFWNAGDASIRPQNVLKPFVVEARPKVRIVDAILKKTSRDVAGIKLDLTQLDQGRIPVSWKILENGDGAVIQVIYVGEPSVSLQGSGIIEQQGDIKKLEYNKAIGSRFTIYDERRRIGPIIGWGSIILGPIALIFLALDFFSVSWFRGAASGLFNIQNLRFIIFINGVGYLVLGIYILWTTPISGPPFGF
jgi:hypothetical protein